MTFLMNVYFDWAAHCAGPPLTTYCDSEILMGQQTLLFLRPYGRSPLRKTSLIGPTCVHSELHSVSDYKKHLHKKQLVDLVLTKKRTLVYFSDLRNAFCRKLFLLKQLRNSQIIFFLCKAQNQSCPVLIAPFIKHVQKKNSRIYANLSLIWLIFKGLKMFRNDCLKSVRI